MSDSFEAKVAQARAAQEAAQIEERRRNDIARHIAERPASLASISWKATAVLKERQAPPEITVVDITRRRRKASWLGKEPNPAFEEIGRRIIGTGWIIEEHTILDGHGSEWRPAPDTTSYYGTALFEDGKVATYAGRPPEAELMTLLIGSETPASALDLQSLETNLARFIVARGIDL